MSTYTPIISQTTSGSTATITFTSIPQNYTDLIVVINGNTNADDEVRIRFNNDGGTNYSETGLYGNGSGGGQNTKYTSTNYVQLGGVYTSGSGRGTDVIHIMNYANTSTYKTVINRSSSGNYTQMRANLWRGSTGSSFDAINRIDFYSASGTFSDATTFTIYGVAAGNSSAKASGGNIVITDGSYWYHAFTSSGTFTPSVALTADYLVVAGGGAGGSHNAGGGGAGGLRSTVTATGGGGSPESPLSLSANTVYTAIIGAGGVGLLDARGGSGSNSTFASITCIGGGGGSGNNNGQGPTSGGSGGAGGANVANPGAAGTANQGYAGGGGGNTAGGGGGGAGVIGQSSTSSGSAAGGNGGDGIWTALSDATKLGQLSSTHYYLAGGGGGSAYIGNTQGTGGLGGGSAGTLNTLPSNGAANTGGGGGAENRLDYKGGNGGSGIIIIRYAV